MGKLQVIVGGQYGSEGKGAVAGYLAGLESEDDFMGVRVAGPNAGHTVIDSTGREWKLQQVPVAAVTHRNAELVISAGSEIDLDLLYREVAALDEAGFEVGSRLLIDSEATVINEGHVLQERGAITGTMYMAGETAPQALPHGAGGITKSIGSTGKGVGAARADRLMRKAKRFGDVREDQATYRTDKEIAHFLQSGGTVQVEGTQGYGLGLRAGHYPFCTSSDCRAIDFLGMAGISPWADYIRETEIWICLRTYPIRVAGNSGPMEGEITWEELAGLTGGYVKPELTTVTKKVRRVGSWDTKLALDAIRGNGGPKNVRLALMFFDYWHTEAAGKTELDHSSSQWSSVNKIERELRMPFSLLGTGPATMIDLRDAR